MNVSSCGFGVLSAAIFHNLVDHCDQVEFVLWRVLIARAQLVHQLIHATDRIFGRLQHVFDESRVRLVPLSVTQQQRQVGRSRS